MYRFLLRPRWVVLHIIMLVAMPLFAVAGFWQLRRLDERRAHNALVESRSDLPPVSALDGDDLRFRRAELTGRYDDRHFHLNGRPSRGRPGDHLLTPLRLQNGAVIVVDRGWVPPDTQPGEVGTPEGRVTVEGILFPSEGRAPYTPSDARGTRLARIDLERLDGHVDANLAPVYLLLDDQQPAQPRSLPEPVEPARLTEGSHLSYAVQWFLFIPTAIAVYVLVLRREARRDRRHIAYDAGA